MEVGKVGEATRRQLLAEGPHAISLVAISARQWRGVGADRVAVGVVVQVEVQNAVVDRQNRRGLITLGATGVGGGPTIAIPGPSQPVITDVDDLIGRGLGERTYRCALRESVHPFDR